MKKKGFEIVEKRSPNLVLIEHHNEDIEFYECDQCLINYCREKGEVEEKIKCEECGDLISFKKNKIDSLKLLIRCFECKKEMLLKDFISHSLHSCASNPLVTKMEKKRKRNSKESLDEENDQMV